MTSGATSLPDAIRFAMQYQLRNIHTAMPGQIISYDFTIQKATIQPTINKLWTDGTTTKMPILTNVPVIFPASGGASMTFPVNVGDPCLILINERSIEEWLERGGIVTPLDPRIFDLSDAVAIMGLIPFNGDFPLRANNTDATFTYSGSSITITEDGAIKLNTASTIALGTSTVELISQLITIFNVLGTSGSGLNGVTRTACNLIASNLTTIQGSLP